MEKMKRDKSYDYSKYESEFTKKIKEDEMRKRAQELEA